MHIKTHIFKGYVFGAIQPSLLLRFPANHGPSSRLCAAMDVVGESLGIDAGPDQFHPTETGFDKLSGPACIVAMLDMFQQHCGDQRLTPIRVFPVSDSVSFVYPSLVPDVARANLTVLAKMLEGARASLSKDSVNAHAMAMKIKARPFLPSGTNAISFIAAAAKYRIPFKQLERRYIAFGYGKDTSIFNSSITDRDSAVGIGIAGSKFVSHRLLKLSGFPVAEQLPVTSVENAIASAQSIGYPVVLKPENEEGGRGVCPNILSEEELVFTYNRLQPVYPKLLLEKHIRGDGYRVYVLGNEIVRVRRLQAAHIIGDGLRDVKTLIDAENASPSRHAINASMKPIKVDQELSDMIAKQGHTLTSVPVADEKVVLAATTNLSRGGSSTDFIDELHVSNKRACIEIAKTFGLYCCGIDLISNDASRPLRENGGVVCEVNAQPQIGSVGRVRMHEDMILTAVRSCPPIDLRVHSRPVGINHSIFNKAANRLRIDIDVKTLLTHGCPVQYFDSLEIVGGVSEEDRMHLEALLESVRPDLSPA
ncbi:hypothetical protein NNA36_11880 [Shimia sp. CNT1-13L.2]|uniref:ATP-binding protein n=1 Tax=Shimia sp. CNT1-13L.2 TaxID=2959663 RepID=UPI0020CC09C7|nr:hypothetical protein [Shimia sp. CNT1-13L.2]MCP9482661.1 hypothetical protein [Shimia sp. CNT1-13L.2]